MRLKLTIGLVLLGCSTVMAGPMSRAGWGQLEWNGNAAEMARGGTGIADRDSLRISLRNPASIHGARLTRLQLGFGAINENTTEAAGSHAEITGSFDNFSLSFPLTWQQTSVALGMRPYSRMNFSLSSKGSNSEDEEYFEFLKGFGGFSLASMTIAKAWPGTGLQVGVELGYFFGSLRQEYSLFHPAPAPPFDVANNYRLGATGLHSRLGLLWQANPELSFGLVVQLPTSISMSLDQESASNNTDTQQDLGNTDLPTSFEVGLRWQRGVWATQLDLKHEDWGSTELNTESSGSLSIGKNQDASDAIAVGVERLHESDFTLAWYRKWDWRAGFRYSKEYIAWNSAFMLGGADSWQDINSLTLSAGCSIPTRSRQGWFDLAVEVNMRGDQSSLGLEEQSARLRVAFAGSDLWFLRRKYD